MSKFEKFWQRFFIFFFSAISLFIIVVGIYRAKKAPSISEAPTPTPTGGDTGQGTQTNGSATLTFAGKTYQTPYGNVSAAIKVKNGKIVAVTMPSLPDSPPSHYAQPILIDQALKAGSANIQGVSGATYTSNAFKLSLESALAQAKASGQQPTAQTPSGVPTVPTTSATPPVDNTGALSFVGKTVGNPYGNSSAAIKIKGGKIVAVTMPQVPNSPPSQYAAPILIDQALKAGSANIQGVSGATYTTNAFKTSLENAIAQAKAQGVTVTPGTPRTTTAPAPSVPAGLRDDD